MKKRVALLDLLRGTAMIYVIFYHIMFDLRFIFGVSTPNIITPLNDVFEISHIFFLWILFGISGICVSYSRDPVKRGALLYLAGFGITAVTEIVMPSELIVFGVLSCFGACMVITGLTRKALDRLPMWSAIVTALLWFILRDFPKTIDLIAARIPLSFPQYRWLYPIGIYSKDFMSADYFPVIPFIFMYLTGYIISPAVKGKKLPDVLYYETNSITRPIEFIGRYSLIIYLVHQPVIFGLMSLIIQG